MSAIIIATGAPFGVMTTNAVSRLIALNSTLPRIQSAVAVAEAGYEGTPGTEFEAGQEPPNNFGVQADPTAPGKQGQAYAYAVGQLNQAWETFWTAAAPYIDQLDSGAQSL